MGSAPPPISGSVKSMDFTGFSGPNRKKKMAGTIYVIRYIKLEFL